MVVQQIEWSCDDMHLTCDGCWELHGSDLKLRPEHFLRIRRYSAVSMLKAIEHAYGLDLFGHRILQF